MKTKTLFIVGAVLVLAAVAYWLWRSDLPDNWDQLPAEQKQQWKQARLRSEATALGFAGGVNPFE